MRLGDDHARAKRLEQVLSKLPWVENTLPVETNIVVFTLKNKSGVGDILTKLREADILAMQFGPGMVRMVMHLDVDDAALAQVVNVLQRIGE